MRLVPLALAAALLLPAGAGAAPIRIGAVFSATGAAGVYGISQAQGARLAVRQLNASGALERRVRLRVLDDHSDPAAATAAFDTLIDDGSVALLGPTLSSAALQADAEAQRRRVPVLGVSNTIDGITEIGRWVFRDSLAESVVQPLTVRRTHDRLHYATAAIVWAAPDAYSAAGRAVFRKALAAQGVDIVADASFASAEQDAYRAAVDTAAAAHPDVLVIAALAGDAAKVMLYARSLDQLHTVPFIGGNSFNTPGLLAEAQGAAMNSYSGAAWFAGRATPGNAAFVEAFKARYGPEPDQFAAQAYAGVRLLAAAVRREGATRSAIRRGLAGLRRVPTVLGRFSFTRGREPVYDPIVLFVGEGGYEPF